MLKKKLVALFLSVTMLATIVSQFTLVGIAAGEGMYVSAPGNEILYDGNVESNISGCRQWCYTNDEETLSSIVVDNTVLHDGKPTIKTTASGKASCGDLNVDSTGISLKSGDTIKFSGFIKTENVSGAGARFIIGPIQGDFVSDTRDWTYVEKTATLSADIADLNINYAYTWATGTAWFQGLRIEKVVSNPNLLYNGAAEIGNTTGMAYYTSAGDATQKITVDGTVAHDGKSSLRIANTDSGANTSMYSSTRIDLLAGTTVKITGYIKTDNVVTTDANNRSIGARYTLTPFTGEGYSNRGDGIVLGGLDGTNGWTYVERLYTAETATQLEFNYALEYATGTAWFQGLKVEKVVRDANLLYNSNVESNISNCRQWCYTNNDETLSSIVVDNTVLHDGKPTIKSTASGKSSCADLNVDSTGISLKSGDTIKVSGFIKTENVSGEGARLIVGPIQTNFISGTRNWTYVEKTVTLTADIADLAINYAYTWATGTAWFQGLEIEKIIQNQPDPNVLYNGEAESNITGYRTWGTPEGSSAPVISVDNTVTHDGKSSIKVAASVSSIQDLYIENTGITIAVGDTIKISGYIKSENLESTSGGGARFVAGTYATDYITGTRDWTYVEKTVTATEETANITFFYNLTWSSGTVWFQGFKVERVVEDPEDPEVPTARPQITANRTQTPPTIDGNISDNEWGSPVITMTPDSAYFVSYEITDDSVLPNSANVYVTWDASKLYIAAQVDDPIHYNAYTGGDIWNGDAFEFDLGFDANDQKNRFRTTFALSTVDGKSYGYQYRDMSGDTSTKVAPATCKVSRTGTITTYEIAYTWSALKADAPKANDKFYLNPQIMVAKDGDLIGYVRYGNKTATGIEYPMVTLAGDPDDGFIDDSGVLKYSLYPSRMVMRSNAGCTGANMGTGAWATWSPAKNDPDVAWAPNISVDTATKHNNYDSVKIVNANSSCTVSALYTAALVEPGEKYRVTGWIKTDNVQYNADVSEGDKPNLGARFVFAYYNESAIQGELLQQYQINWDDAAGGLSGTNDWTKVTKVFTMPANCKVAKFGMNLWAATGTAWFSEVKVEKVITTPAVWYNSEAESSMSGYNTWCYTGEGVPAKSSIVIDNTVTRDGKSSLKFSATESSMADLYIPLNIALKKGESAKISGYIKAENVISAGAGARLILRKVQNTDLATTEYITGTKDWTYVEKIVTASEDAELQDLIYNLTWSSGTVWFQGVKAEKVTLDTPPEDDDDLPYIPPEDDDDIFNPGDDNDEEEPVDTGDTGVAIPALVMLSSVSFGLLVKRKKSK